MKSKKTRENDKASICHILILNLAQPWLSNCELAIL